MAPFCTFDFNTSPIIDMNRDFFHSKQGRISPPLPLSSFLGNDDLEPVPIGAHRNPYEQAAMQSLLKESVEFLFGQHPSKQDAGDAGTNNKKRKRSNCANNLQAEQRFRPYQNQKWDERFEALKEFRRINGHCSVPYDYPPNPTLARWVKRQRYQYNLYAANEPSAMTADRVRSLEQVGFVWDTYAAAWERRVSELRSFLAVNGHCNVPGTYQPNKKLAAWVKCQRRQYKMYTEGKPSTLTCDRIDDLNHMGFQWEMR